MMIRNVINSCNLYEKERAAIMVFLVMAASIFSGLISVAGEVYAQEVEQKIPRPAEPDFQNLSVIGAAYEKLLLDADALIKNGKPADAYILLEPFEFDHAGEERFDYLIGIAALDSGKPDKATLALERVLMINPNSAAARLDIARAYYQLGDLPRARTEFEVALKQNPAGTARANIEKYLDEIAARETGSQTHFTGYIEGTVGHDSNVNSSTSQSQIFVDALAATTTSYPLDPANVKTPDNYYGLAAGGEIIRNLNPNWDLYAGADLRQRDYHTQKSFDSLNLDTRTGVMFGAKANHLRIGLLAGQYNLGGSRNSAAAGLNAEWRHTFSPANQLKIFGQYAQYRYADLIMQPNDYDQQVIGGGWLHAMADGKSTLFGSLYYGTEKDVSTVITSTTPNGGRTDGAKRFSGLRIGGQTNISDRMTLFANAGIQVGDYSKVNPLFFRQRSDRYFDLTAGADWQWCKHWTLRPQLNYSKDDSNIVIYAFNRMDVSLNIRRDFR